MSNNKRTGTDSVENESHRMSTKIDRNSEELPKIRSKSFAIDRDKDFNKYYIQPSMRYKQKVENPKESTSNYDDETFVYKNLHNYKFWNWVHPLDKYQLKPTPNTISNKVNIPVLEKFKTYMETNAKKRVPLVIKEILNHQL